MGEAGLRPAAPEQLADGPAAAAVAPTGEILVLDRLNHRVLALADGASAQTVAEVPEDAEDLAVGGDGALLVYSPLRSLAWVLSAGAVDELAVPRVIDGVTGVALLPSHQVWLATAFQESVPLGSPHAPRALAAVLHGKREGAFLLADGTGVAVRRLADGHPELLHLGRGEHAPVLARHTLADVVRARLVGVAGARACLLLERGAPGAGVAVSRRLTCVDLDDGREVLGRDLPGRGTYQPRRELAVGGAPARVVFLHPEEDGLHVEAWPLPAEVQP